HGPDRNGSIGAGSGSGHGRFDGVYLEEAQELLGRMGAVIALRRDDAEVPVELDILERHDLEGAVLDSLTGSPGGQDGNAHPLFHGALDGFGAAQGERYPEVVQLDPVVLEMFQDDLAGARALFPKDERFLDQ